MKMFTAFAVVTASALLLFGEVHADRASGALRATADRKLKASGGSRKNVGPKSGKKSAKLSKKSAKSGKKSAKSGKKSAKLSKKTKKELKASKELRNSITVDGMFVHLDALQAIGTQNGGNRFTGTQGYEDSVAYAAGVFEGAGYDVKIQEFNVTVFELDDVPEMSSLTFSFEEGVDFSGMTFSGSGTATGPVAFVPAFGCNTADFESFPANSIAVISRGVCAFADKALNAQEAGTCESPLVLASPCGRGMILNLPSFVICRCYRSHCVQRWNKT
jgi:hypothetical protein